MDLFLTHCWNLVNAEHKALLDTGAEGLFVDEKIARRKRQLITPLQVRNVDGTDNEGGRITHETRIKFSLGNKDFDEWCYVTKLGDQDVILGMPWFKRHNPLIDWNRQSIEAFNWTSNRRKHDAILQLVKQIHNISIDVTVVGNIQEEALIYLIDANFIPEEEVWVRAKTSVTTQLAQEAEEHRVKMILPDFYKKYEKVFHERESGKMPVRREWDHEIILKPDFKPKQMAPYPMDQNMEGLTLKWLDEMKIKGFI